VPVLYAAGELDATYSSIARQLAAASLPQSLLQVSLLPGAAHAVLVQARWRCA
jgi:pimeloyl-ACP methyl ester carboxylesterase